jgi:hypothetical protein
MLYETDKSKLFILHVTPEPHLPEQLSIYLSQEKLGKLRTPQKKELDKELNTHYLRRLKIEMMSGMMKGMSKQMMDMS